MQIRGWLSPKANHYLLSLTDRKDMDWFEENLFYVTLRIALYTLLK
jgi:hypothetical protein